MKKNNTKEYDEEFLKFITDKPDPDAKIKEIDGELAKRSILLYGEMPIASIPRRRELLEEVDNLLDKRLFWFKNKNKIKSFYKKNSVKMDSEKTKGQKLQEL